MAKISSSPRREIISDFVKEIQKKKITKDVTPESDVIEFRNERQENIPRPVVKVPIELLLYRKDNGRIASDVSTFEKLYCKLPGTSEI